MVRKALLGVFVIPSACLVLVVVIQFVPFGRDKANPPVLAEPKWDSPATRELAVRACFDCHGNDTVRPGYSNIAPVSWLLVWDVNEGRRTLNFPEWNRPQRGTREVTRQIERGEMPPSYYVWLHPAGGLSRDETQRLIQGLQTTLGVR